MGKAASSSPVEGPRQRPAGSTGPVRCKGLTRRVLGGTLNEFSMSPKLSFDLF